MTPKTHMQLHIIVAHHLCILRKKAQPELLTYYYNLLFYVIYWSRFSNHSL